ncbi:uncharacterized protein LOC108939598 [Arapaima gigas]
MESVNGDSWRRLPEFCIRQGWGIEGASDWRRSGNESSLQKPMSNVGTPLRPHRPKSCIEGSSITGLDQWLEKLERTKGSPVCFEGTTYTDRTKSLPVPPKEVSGQVHQRHSDNPGFHSSWNTTLSTSEDRQTVHLRCLPKGQPITPCALAAVQSSWLPVQSRAVLCNLPSRPNMSGEYSGQAPFNSDISSIMAENLHMKNVTKCTDRGSAEVQSQSEDSTSPGIQHFPGQVPVRLNQERGESFVSVGSCVTAGQKGQLKEWKTIMPDNHLSSGRAEVSRDSSLHRSTSTPEGPSLTVPTMGGITGLSKMRSGFSSITIASRKVPQATNNNKSDRPEHSTLTPAAPGYIAVFQPAVVYRRKATAIKVTGRRQSYTMGEALDGSHPTTFRHSYAEGDSKDNSLSPFLLQSSGSLLQDFVGTCDLSKEPVEPTCSTACLKKSEDLGGGGQKIHRSTLSLYLSRPSSGPTSGNRPRRPLSFTGGLNDTNNKSADLEQRRKSLGPSGETSNDRCHQAGPGSNTRTMQERATHGDTQHKAVDKAKDPGLLHLWNPARNPHPAFIRARDNGWRHSPDLTLALNAASVIAYIKQQNQLKKRPVILPGKDARVSHDSCNLGISPRFPPCAASCDTIKPKHTHIFHMGGDSQRNESVVV